MVKGMDQEGFSGTKKASVSEGTYLAGITQISYLNL